MKSLRAWVIFVLGVVAGAGGMAIYKPSPAHALGGLTMKRMNEGTNFPLGNDVRGFACTSQDCYVLTE